MSSIKDLIIVREREDGKEYTTTLGTMEEDAKKQAELLAQERAAKEEKRRKWQLRKEKFLAWWKKWWPTIWKVLQVVGILAILAAIIYVAFWIIIGAIVLMAVGAGMSEGGSEGVARANHYNKVNRDYYNQESIRRQNNQNRR